MIVRAREGDLDRVYPIILRFFKEFNFLKPEDTDPIYLLNEVAKALCYDDHWIGLLLDDETKEIDGLIWGCLNTVVFSSTRFAQDVMFYIRPEARGGFRSFTLVKAFEDWSREQPNVYAIILHASPGIGGRTAFLKRMKFSLYGETWTKKY